MAMSLQDQQRADELYMRRCISLALNAEGRTYPNPMVGAVIVYNDRIIGEGWHHKAGQPHAEVNAVNSVLLPDRKFLPASTIYVSLEPCAHYGKTPPCAELIIRTHFRRVVVGCKDSFKEVSGKGIDMIRRAGIEVKVGVLEEQCRHLNRRFFAMQELARPYITLKWAETADSFIGMKVDDDPVPVNISDSVCRSFAHHLRHTEQAILVGVSTVVADNPSLNTRYWTGNSPRIFVIDPHSRCPQSSKIFYSTIPPTLFVDKSTKTSGTDKVPIDFSSPDALAEVVKYIASLGLQSVLVEGGAFTLSRFIEAGLYDEIHVFKSSELLGDGIKAPTIPHATLLSDERVGNCRLMKWKKL